MSDFKLELGIEEELVKPSDFKDEDTSLSISSLSDTERQQIDEFSQKIDLNNYDIVALYGVNVQNKIAKFSDSVLKTVRTKDMAHVGEDLSALVANLKSYDPAGGERTGIARIFRGKPLKLRMDRMMADFSKVETNVDAVVKNLETHQRQLIQDNVMLSELYKNNYEYYKELSMYIIAGKQSLENFIEVDIPAQRKIAEESHNQMEVQKLNDMINQANRFEKRLHDLKLSRTISIQMAPQVRLVQNNGKVLIEKIQSSIVNSIPLWKNQMVLSLGMANTQRALQVQKDVTDMTNQLLLKNSEMLKQGSIDIAREAERGIVSVETLQKTNENLITTISEVLQIQKQGSEERAQAEISLQNIENEIKQVLLEATNKQ
ncbi:MAG: toxic anion resistance protein [Defluviitaleaceae bacterium]|nr:toxic anion resistance protein [Defluviitaleaceae bacterium]